MPTPGERFGPYDIVAPLGSGGMGVVFRARDSRLGREVAIKMLPPESASDPTRLQRFEAEARAASALNHPNVLSVFDVGREGTTPYLVMELLVGETLRERLTAGVLTPKKTIEIGMQVAQGLAAVHEKGIVHRDLKPENLFLTRDGHLKILDFGVARTTEGPGTPPTGTLPMTADGAVMGTAGYMSPEQVRGRPADARSDVFALGAILSECLTGKMAFPGETPVERGYAILNSDPVPAVGATSPALMKVISRCLEKDPSQRFQHARDLVFALEALHDTTSSPVAAQGGSRWVPVVALAASVVLIVVALSFMRPTVAPGPVVAAAAEVALDAGHASSKRVSFRNGLIANARFTNDGHGVAYAGAFEGMPWKVYTGVLDGPQMRSVTANGTILFDVSATGDIAVGSAPEDGTQKGMVLSRGSLAGGAPRPLYESVLSADFGPQDVMLLVRLVDSRWVIESPPGQVILTSTENLGPARLSPDGQYIAFPRLPVMGDDRGTVDIIDRTGKLVARSKQAWTLEGVAWNAKGDEVWFSAGYEDASRRIYALSLSGAQREVFAAPGNLRLLDIDPQGRALVASSLVRSRMFGKLNGETTERSWSWLDGSMPLDLSNDGKAVLFLEGFGPSTAEVQTWLRRFDTGDDTPIMLSLGWGRALSPDRRWAVVSPTAPFNTLRLVPTGAGAPRDLKAGDFQGINQVRFFRDGQRIVFSALDHDNHPHLYLQSLVAAGKEDEGPRLVHDGEFALTAPPSPDGKYLVGFDTKARKGVLVPVDRTDGEVQPLPQLTTGDMPMQWTDDGKKLWIARRDKKLPGISLFQYELGSGRLTPNGVITPADPVGMDHVKSGLITPDGGAYVYTVNQELDELYLIEGVR